MRQGRVEWLDKSASGPSRAAMSIYIGPIAGALLSRAILGEPPFLLHIFGGLFILGGVWISLRK